MTRDKATTRLEGEDFSGRSIGPGDRQRRGAPASGRGLWGRRLTRKLDASKITCQRGGGLSSGDVGSTMTARRDRRRAGVNEAAERGAPVRVLAELLQQLRNGGVRAGGRVNEGGLQHGQGEGLLIVDKRSVNGTSPSVKNGALVLTALERVLLELCEQIGS